MKHSSHRHACFSARRRITALKSYAGVVVLSCFCERSCSQRYPLRRWSADIIRCVLAAVGEIKCTRCSLRFSQQLYPSYLQFSTRAGRLLSARVRRRIVILFVHVIVFPKTILLKAYGRSAEQEERCAYEPNCTGPHLPCGFVEHPSVGA